MYDDNGADKIKNETKQRKSRQRHTLIRTVISSHMRKTTHCSRLSSESRDLRKQSVFKETDINDKLLRMNIYFAYFIHCQMKCRREILYNVHFKKALYMNHAFRLHRQVTNRQHYMYKIMRIYLLIAAFNIFFLLSLYLQSERSLCIEMTIQSECINRKTSDHNFIVQSLHVSQQQISSWHVLNYEFTGWQKINKKISEYVYFLSHSLFYNVWITIC